jgi:hypothetical protein
MAVFREGQESQLVDERCATGLKSLSPAGEPVCPLQWGLGL